MANRPFPGWLAASLVLAAGVWVIDQFNRSYAWMAAVLSLLSILVVQVRENPTVLDDLWIPWETK